jgi:hypothetical protein
MKSKRQQSKRKFRFWELHPDGGAVKGIIQKEPKMRKQDKKFRPGEFYAVVFFPKITLIGKAGAHFHEVSNTISQSPDAAKTRFMDGIKQGEKWETYVKAGHRIRKVRVVDLGDA